MLSIRLSRTGKKKQPHYRVIVVDKRRDPWGKSIEILGHRNPRTKETVLKEDRIKHWIDQGAQPSNTVWNLLVDAKIAEGDKRGVTHISKKRANKGKGAEEKTEELKNKGTEEPKEEASSSTEATEDKSVEAEEKPTEEEKPAE